MQAFIVIVILPDYWRAGTIGDTAAIGVVYTHAPVVFDADWL
jgi:hypothetical protein